MQNKGPCAWGSGPRHVSYSLARRCHPANVDAIIRASAAGRASAGRFAGAPTGVADRRTTCRPLAMPVAAPGHCPIVQVQHPLRSQVLLVSQSAWPLWYPATRHPDSALQHETETRLCAGGNTRPPGSGETSTLEGRPSWRQSATPCCSRGKPSEPLWLAGSPPRVRFRRPKRAETDREAPRGARLESSHPAPAETETAASTPWVRRRPGPFSFSNHATPAPPRGPPGTLRFPACQSPDPLTSSSSKADCCIRTSFPISAQYWSKAVLKKRPCISWNSTGSVQPRHSP